VTGPAASSHSKRNSPSGLAGEACARLRGIGGGGFRGFEERQELVAGAAGNEGAELAVGDGEGEVRVGGGGGEGEWFRAGEGQREEEGGDQAHGRNTTGSAEFIPPGLLQLVEAAFCRKPRATRAE
jgi:hypothetical protein